jgi:hypothetical protein
MKIQSTKDNILVIGESGSLLHESVLEVDFKNLGDLRRFGEMVAVTTKKEMKGNHCS